MCVKATCWPKSTRVPTRPSSNPPRRGFFRISIRWPIPSSTFSATRRSAETISPPRQQIDTQAAQVAAQQNLIEADQAQIDAAKVSLSYTAITAPIGGRTGLRQVDAGNIVHPADATPIVVLTSLQPIAVLFTLPEQDLSTIQDSHATLSSLHVQALDSAGKVLEEGSLDLVDNQIDQSTGTIKLKASFPNSDLRLWPGQFVTARLIVNVRHDGIVVPAQAIQNGPDGPYVFVIGSDNKVAIQPVRVARVENGTALMDDGIRAGQRVVLDGQSRLRPGAEIRQAASPSTTRG